jgi:hypothetical protein
VARKLVAISIVLVIAWRVWPRREASPPELQVAASGDGFVVLHDREVIHTDGEGKRRAATPLDVPGDVRIAGRRTGPVIAWQDGKRIRLRELAGREIGAWGKAVVTLCDGVASNAARYGFAWLEADNSVWLIGASAGRSVEASSAAAKTDWCGIASAGPDVELFWRQQDRLFAARCDSNGCSPIPAVFAVDRNTAILGFGCIRGGCLVAMRDAAGARLAYFDGKRKWSRPLDGAIAVSIVGAVDRFAVAIATPSEGELVRIAPDGTSDELWRDAVAAPLVVGASARRVMLAYRRGGALVHDVFAF